MKMTIIVVLLAFFSIGLGPFSVVAHTADEGTPHVHAPDTIEDTKEDVLRVGDKITNELFGIIPNIWKNEVLPTWKGMWKWLQKAVWRDRLQPAYDAVADQVEKLFRKEIEKRKPILEQELQQEADQLKQELKDRGTDATKSLWERFRDLFH